jgi:hypothetical protein
MYRRDTNTPSTGTRNQTFRLSAEMDDRIRKCASESGRTISQEIQFRLEKAYTSDQTSTVDFAGLVKRMDALERHMNELARTVLPP